MKLVRYDGGRLGVMAETMVVDITDLSPLPVDSYPQVNDIALYARLPLLENLIHDAARHRVGRSIESVHLQSPVSRPANLIAFPVNYLDHKTEMASANRADLNGFFLKATSSLSGANEPIHLPNLVGRVVHHECELAIVIGREGRHLTRENALDHVLGYSCLIDVTVRGNEERVMRKSFDTFTPLGPWIVTAEEIADPNNLEMTLSVNGSIRQQASTRDLIVDIQGMLVLASSVMTLQPGDVIATGTPAGVGPLHDGDVVNISISGVGSMSISVVTDALGSNIAFESSVAAQAISSVLP